MKPRGLLVAGTDTGVGKTSVAAGLARLLRDRGVDVGVMKPAATGVPPDGDADLLRAAAGCDDPLDLVSPLRLRDPLAPAAAAEREGSSPDPASLLRAFAALAARRRFVVVEGVGGLLVPVAWNWTLADMAREFALPVLLVARAGLGTLNHVALTLEAARARELRVLGVVLVREHGGPPGLAEETNPASLRRLGCGPLLRTLERLPADGAADPAALAAALARTVDLAPVYAEVDRGDA